VQSPVAVCSIQRKMTLQVCKPCSGRAGPDKFQSRGVFRGGFGGPWPLPPIVDWVDVLQKKRLCWDCSLYQKCSVDLKYAKNALAGPRWGAHNAPPDSLVSWGGMWGHPLPRGMWGHPLPNPHLSQRDSRAFGVELLSPM